MSKKERIKEAWGELFKELSVKAKDYILNNNGQISLYILDILDRKILLDDNDIRKEDSAFECTRTDEGTKYVFRPKSLRGIEDNNGWIKIESEDDLPKQDDLYWAVVGGEIEILETWEIKLSFHNKKTITHYQQIEKPKPLLY